MAGENSWVSCRSEVKSSGLPYGQIPKDKGSHTMVLQDKECQGGEIRVVFGLEHFSTLPCAFPAQRVVLQMLPTPHLLF